MRAATIGLRAGEQGLHLHRVIRAVPNFWPIGARVDAKTTIHCRRCGWVAQEFDAQTGSNVRRRDVRAELDALARDGHV
jgi:hypothetical protein